MERLKISKKEFEDGNYTPIVNLAKFKVLLFPKYRVLSVFRNKNKNLDKLRFLVSISGDKKDLFLNKYGKQDFVWYSEYREYAWSFKLPSGNLIVFTGKRGTSFEYEGTEPTKNDVSELNSFLNIIRETSE